MQEQPKIFTVSELAHTVKQRIENEFDDIWLEAEIGNYKVASSGHVYMDLKDKGAVLACVMWRGVYAKLQVALEEGLSVLCRGRMTTYPDRSVYQLILTHIEIAGIGALMQLLRQRETQLRQEGLFLEQHKKQLPLLPSLIAVITSPTGAVIQDILHRMRDRFPLHIVIYPCLVQGKEAHLQVAKAINDLQAPLLGLHAKPDVIIVARGGGSLEDLWAFNEEGVVRAAFASTIPIVSAIGHETDITLLDLVADKRAPTPTAAAEMCIPERHVLQERTHALAKRAVRSLLAILAHHEKLILQLAKAIAKPATLLLLPRQRLDYLHLNLMKTGKYFLNRPYLVLEKFFHLQRGLQQLHKQQRQKIKDLTTRLENGILQTWKQKHINLSFQEQKLRLYDVEHTLSRGFVMAQTKQGKLIRSPQEIPQSSPIRLRFAQNQEAWLQAASCDRKGTRKKPQGETQEGKVQLDLF